MKKYLLPVLIICLLAGSAFINEKATAKVFSNQPSWYFINPDSYRKFLHLGAAGFGVRSLAGDVEYINFLQYYGDRSQNVNRHKNLVTYIDDITDVDPYFSFAYTYGSSILAFNLNRVDEALKVIRKGLDFNPKIWQLRLYLGAILYKQENKESEYIKLLEDALRFEDHPAIVERILGNIYEQIKTPQFAAEYWAGIYIKTKDKKTRDFAYQRVEAIIKEGRLTNPSAVIKILEK
ncbi:MAG: hypothetical protein CVV21_06060 [Candidatus Goldiibacteriota bacterium HGW-Goldbacteria-1]|jgi:tetratricopeptide (TPR) repeat protein|nr:MAG: hypothetical protein CVV21_06060 [Candidatus Goldiibacteriota bacterium HGW-Goldbacteria-1]